jgi:hypothetical protein
MQKCEIVSVPGSSLWTVHHGNGTALVCCHGGPGLWDYLAPVAEMVDDLVADLQGVLPTMLPQPSLTLMPYETTGISRNGSSWDILGGPHWRLHIVSNIPPESAR